MIGSTIAHYKITAKLGEGGMGEVYRARDDRLNRDVAVKILPQSVQDDAERLARFRREAQVLASLTHGNIAQVYGLEEHEGSHAIVLELVEGEDLSQRIARGPIPLDEARQIATQIAEALEAAHEKGIVHRDLKPANVKLAPDGMVKVLDFGLAKALSDDQAESEISTSPTMTAAATQAGFILGTAAYMAPEQAKGKPVDRRADVWAFGCVLYEMLTGRAPFGGDGVSEVLAHVITQEPDLDALPAGVPAPLRDLLQRCLRKDPRKRVPDIGVARIALQEMDDAVDDPTELDMRRPPKGVLLAWWLPGGAGLLIGLAIAWFALSGQSASRPAATHFDLVLDPPQLAGRMALSSDGTTLFYSGLLDGTRRLFARRLDGHTSDALPGTEGGYDPILSPDGRHVGFVAGGELRRVNLAGGSSEMVTPTPGVVTGSAWADDDTILFTTDILKMPHRVDADGGESSPLRINDVEPGTEFHHPCLLPDNRKLLLTRKTATEQEIILLDTASGDSVPLVRGSGAHFVEPDRLLFVQEERVMEIGFDPGTGKIVGDSRPAGLDEPVFHRTSFAPFLGATSAGNGTLVYSSGVLAENADLLRVSADGAAEPTGLTGYVPRADSEGRRVAVRAVDGTLHILDLVDRTDTALTFEPTSQLPLWSRDEREILYGDRRSAEYETWTVAPDGSSRARRYFENPVPTSLSTSIADDGTIMGYGVHPVTSRDIWIRSPDGEIAMLLATPANERSPAIAPVARLFAYVSDEEGSDQIYLRDLDAMERRWRVTTEGGQGPIWSRDGRELFFARGTSLIGVEVRTDGGVRVGEERIVFSHDRMNRDEWGNRTVGTLPGGGFLVPVQRESQVVLRVVLGFDD